MGRLDGICSMFKQGFVLIRNGDSVTTSIRECFGYTSADAYNLAISPAIS